MATRSRWRWSLEPGGPPAWLLLLLLALATTVAVLPALLGTWVYDDLILPGHPLLDGWNDLPASFVRNSHHYISALRQHGEALQSAVTYRPLPMAWFVPVHVLVGPRPLAHHLVSLSFHLATLAILVRLASRRGRVAWLDAFVCTAFALHPCMVEAYGWINGRADALAGLALAGVALVHVQVPSPRRRALALWPVLVAGALSKETFLLTSAALLVALALPAVHAPRAGLAPLWHGLRRELPSALAWGAAVVVFWSARAFSLIGVREGRIAVPVAHVATDLPRLVALGVETALVPLGRPMRILSWELSRPWTTAHVALLVLAALVVTLLVRRRQLRLLVLLAGAVVALAPAAFLDSGFWLGFDRYLYQPGCLLAIGLVSVGADLPLAPTWRRSVAIASVVLAVVLGLATHAEARTYRSNWQLCFSMVVDRPEDPTGYLLGAIDALRRNQPGQAAAALAWMPMQDLPLPHAHRAIMLHLQLGHLRTAAGLVERALVRHPGEPRLLVDQVIVHSAPGDWSGVIRLSRRLLELRGARRAATLRALASHVQRWQTQPGLPEDVRTQLGRILEQARAGDHPSAGR